ncbi:MAG: sigma-70 family RNA polymerase sigma factor [Chitinophagales bacterium]|nr:sigma-70 family RNA polymerase sigma factor [Chitinophagales bacterium]
MQDIDLIHQYISGDDTAFEALFLKHKDKVYTSIYIIVKDHEVADDIFQDTFIKVLHKLKEEKYAEEGKFIPWVMRIAHNLCMDHFRKNQKEKIVANDNPEYDILDNVSIEESYKEDQIISDEESIDISKYLELLPDEQREIIVFRHYYDYSFKEIADMTGTNINTALGRMRYALINLRKLIKKGK